MLKNKLKIYCLPDARKITLVENSLKDMLYLKVLSTNSKSQKEKKNLDDIYFKNPS